MSGSAKACYILAGPNGAGKTTFAQDFLPQEANCLNYINADLIAAGLAPFAPESVAVKAGKLMLRAIDDCVEKGSNFAFETTLSGLAYVKKIQQWQQQGYAVFLYYFSLPSVEMACNRVAYRASQGGHTIPEAAIRRRFVRSEYNLEKVYKPIVDYWAVYDTASSKPIFMASSDGTEQR